MLDNPKNDQNQTQEGDFNQEGTLGGEAQIQNQGDTNTSEEDTSEE